MAPASSVAENALTVKSLTPANEVVWPAVWLTSTTAWPGRSTDWSVGSFSSGMMLR